MARMKSRNVSRWLAAAMLGGVAWQPVLADFTPWMPAESMVTYRAIQGWVSKSGSTQKPTARTTTRPVAAPTSLRYVVSPAVHQQVFTDLIGRVRAKDPQSAQAIQSAFANYDYDKLYDGIAGPYGLSGNDAGNAITAYLVLGWLIANGQQDVPAGRAAALAARTQIAGTLARNDVVPREKWAELGEDLKLQFLIVHSGWQTSLKENDARHYSDEIARRFSQQFGIDLRAISLDQRGFVRRG
jgi:hypothetical protein